MRQVRLSTSSESAFCVRTVSASLVSAEATLGAALGAGTRITARGSAVSNVPSRVWFRGLTGTIESPAESSITDHGCASACSALIRSAGFGFRRLRIRSYRGHGRSERAILPEICNIYEPLHLSRSVILRPIVRPAFVFQAGLLTDQTL